MARSRRLRGTGSYDAIKKDGKITFYRWRIGFYDPISGKTQYKALKAKTKAALDEKVRLWNEEHGNGDDVSPVAGKRLTVRQWVDRWLASLENKIAASTLARYRRNVERHLIPKFGAMWINKVSPFQLQVYFDEISKTLAAATVRTIRAQFRACFQKAVKYGVLSKNPVSQTDPPKYQKPDLRILQEDEVARLLKVAKDCSYRSPARDDADAYIMRRNYIIVLLALASGMRQSELLGLVWESVNGQSIEVRQSLQNLPGDQRVLKETKNGKPRTVAIPSSVARELESWREYQHAYAEKFKGIFKNDLNLVFTGPLGAVIDGGRLTCRHFRAMCNAAGLDGLRFHDLRHYFASAMISKGVNIAAVSAQLGHSSIEITLQRYTHVLERSMDEMKKMLDADPIFSL